MDKYFDKKKLTTLDTRTPFFAFSKQALLDNLREYKKYLPQKTEICYAMKANSEKIVLQILQGKQTSFEVASKYELDFLKNLRVKPSRIIYGTSVKPEGHIREFVKYGVDRFAFDSESELQKIAKLAPGSRVYTRALLSHKSKSVFDMSSKFGAPLSKIPILLKKAKDMGLVPYGVSFNVGSQGREAKAWAQGISDLGQVMIKLLKIGIKIQIINLGGGFPKKYQTSEKFPSLKQISHHINLAVKKLPYEVGFIAEPGRGLVANTFSLVTSVIGKNERRDGCWVYLDAGVYNALLEATNGQGKTRYQVEPLPSGHKLDKKKDRFILTGPTGDNIDIINQKILLPTNLQTLDKLLIHDVGAYTFTLMTRFNGFPKPKVITKFP